MMGISCDYPAFIYGDNQSVLVNTSMPDSQLKKKSNSIAFHCISEGTARDEWRFSYINTHENPSDILTKSITNSSKRDKISRTILHHL